MNQQIQQTGVKTSSNSDTYNTDKEEKYSILKSCKNVRCKTNKQKKTRASIVHVLEPETEMKQLQIHLTVWWSAWVRPLLYNKTIS